MVSQGELEERIDVEFYSALGSVDRSHYITLDEIVDVKGGKRIPKGKSYSDTFVGYKYLRVEDISELGAFEFESLYNIDENVYSAIERYTVDKNDIIISIAGTIGKVSLIDRDYDKKLVLTENCAKLTIKNKGKILPRYLQIMLQSPDAQNQMEASAGQATIKKLALIRIKELKIPLPPLDQQQRIVDIMDQALATKQTKEQKAQELLDSIDDYVMEELGIEYEEVEEKEVFAVTIDDIDTENLSVGFYATDVDLGKSHKKKLGEIADINPNVSIDQELDVYPYIGLPDTDDGEIKNIDYRTRQKIGGSRVAKKGDILFARIEPSIFNKKYIYVHDLGDNDFAFVSGEFIVIRSKGEVNQKYLYYLLFRDIVYQQFAGKTTGSTGRRRLDLSVLKKIKIPLPPRDIQDRIADEVQSCISQAKQLQSEAEQIYKQAKEQVEEMILGG